MTTAPAPSAPSSGLSAAARAALPALLLGAVGIGFAPIFVRLSEAGPVATAFWRIVFALPALWAWRAAELRREGAAGALPPLREQGAILAAGLAFAGDLAVWHWSIQFTSVANATLLANFAPIFVAFGAWALFGDRPTPLFLGGLALAMGGAVLLMGSSVQLGTGGLFGDGLGLFTAVFYAAYILAVGRARARFSTAAIMLRSGVVTAASLLPVALLSGERLVPATAEGWLVLAGLGLVSHAAGQSLIAFALAHLPAAFSSVALLLQPAIAAGLAWLLLAEPLGPLQAAGAAVILAGILVARRASRR
jgi:drug/metabolite transporter (DMT)-like permease